MPFKKGDPRPPNSGRKKGQLSKNTVTIKAFMQTLMDRPDYRKSLERRLIAGELPQVEVYLLNRFVGKPIEHVEVSAMMPLFMLPQNFKLEEDAEGGLPTALPAGEVIEPELLLEE